MAIAYGSTGTLLNVTVAATSWAVPYPAGIAAGDLLVLHAVTNGGVVSSTPPTGWTEVYRETTATNPKGGIWIKVASGSETGTLTLAVGSTTGVASISRYTGVDTTNPLDVAAQSFVVTVTGDNLADFPSLTTVTANTMLIMAAGANSTSKQWTKPTGSSIQRVDYTETLGTSKSGALFDEAIAAAGATGTRQATFTSPGVAHWGVVMALRPALLGTFNDFYNQSYTGSAKTSGYHVYATGRTTGTTPLGLVIQLHGDGAEEYGTPTSGMLPLYDSSAKAQNMILLAPKTPDVTGSLTWWENQFSPVWLLELIDFIFTKYPGIDPTRVWFMGYSGGAEVQTYWLLSDYSNRLRKGGNIMLGGGGADGLVFSLNPTTAFKTTQRLHWAVGELDTNDGSGFNAYAASQGGYDRYGTEGFTIRAREVITGKDHFTSEPEGPRVLADQLAIAYGAPASGTAPVLVAFQQDIPKTTSQTVKVTTTGATSVRLKVGTDTGLTTGVIFGAAATPDAAGIAQATVTGLAPNTKYYARLAMTNSVGGEHLDNWATVSEFTTDLDGQQNFTIAFGSCCNSVDSPSFAAITAKKPTLFFHLGDQYYNDGSGTTLANFRSKWSGKRTSANQLALLRTAPALYNHSDHDGMNNNTTAATDPTAWANYNTVWREYSPTTDLQTADGVYRTFKRGRVRFISIDRRSYASDPAATDNSSKTSLGATQKQWLKDTITAATEPLILILSPEPWIGAAIAGDDGWMGYTTERTELANFFAASGKNIAILNGDQHALAADDGTNSPGGVAVFNAAPFSQNASEKGGPYTTGTYPTGTTAVVEQYGWIDVTDSGTSIALAFKGFSSDNTQRIALTKTYTISSAYSGTLALSATGTQTRPTAVPAPSSPLALSGSGTLSRAATVGLTGSLGLSGAGTLGLAGGQQAAGNLSRSGSGTLTGTGAPALTGTLQLSASGSLAPIPATNFSGSLALAGAGTLAYARGAQGNTSGLALSATGTQTRATGAVNLTQLLGLTTVGDLLRIPGGTALSAALGLSTAPTLSMAASNNFLGAVSLGAVGTLAESGLPAPRSTMGLFAAANLEGSAYILQDGALNFSGSGSLTSALAGMGTVENVRTLSAAAGISPLGNPAFAVTQNLSAGTTLGMLASLVTQKATVYTYAEGTQFRTALGEAIGSIAFTAGGSLGRVARDPGLKQGLGLSGAGSLSAVCAGLTPSQILGLNGSGSLTGIGTVLARLLLDAAGALTGAPSFMSHKGATALSGSGDLGFTAKILGLLVLQGSGQQGITPGLVRLMGTCATSGTGSFAATGGRPYPRAALGLSASCTLARTPVLATARGSIQRSASGQIAVLRSAMHVFRALELNGSGGITGTFIPQSEIGAVFLAASGALGTVWISGKPRGRIKPPKYYARIRPGRN